MFWMLHILPNKNIGLHLLNAYVGYYESILHVFSHLMLTTLQVLFLCPF